MHSKLFISAPRAELYPKALVGAADAVSLDLDDLVEEGARQRRRSGTGGSR